MQEEKTDGIVLRSQDYKERHRIITLFTPEGLMSLIVRGISRKNARLLSLTTPFCHGEYHYIKGRSELMFFRDGSVIDDHLHLRQSLKALQTAGSLAHAILSSQMAGKPAPALFALYKSYHGQVAQFNLENDPEILLSSFYLKLLKYEGYLNISHEEEPFSPSEWQLILTLEGALQFSTLRNLSVPPHFCKKIHALFQAHISH